jgi:hypothetical protein
MIKQADTDNINNKADKGYNCRIPVECLKISDTHPLFDTQLLDIFCSLLSEATTLFMSSKEEIAFALKEIEIF